MFLIHLFLILFCLPIVKWFMHRVGEAIIASIMEEEHKPAEQIQQEQMQHEPPPQ